MTVTQGSPSPAAPPSEAELLHGLGQAVIATDPEGRIVFWNAAAEDMYGWTAAEVLGRDIAEVTVPQMSATAGAEIMDALRHGSSWSGGFAVQRRDGEVLHALVTDAGIYRDGVLIGIVGESLNLGAAVRHLMERSSDAAVVLNEDHVVSYASPAVTTIFGWPVAELVGARLDERIHPEDRVAFVELVDDDAPGAERVDDLRVRHDDDWVRVEVAVTDLYTTPDVRAQVCNIRRSERLARLEERERLLDAVHSEVLQDLFAASLELDRVLLRAGPGLLPRLEAARETVGRAIGTLREVVKPPAAAGGCATLRG
ncbi:PAS domain-containing protein [Nocardioides sp.]|uniref:sensor histidine kinase n=1 Tax=Nocardioides sp. TaxID=35761 RepID=UPI0037831225